ncbi:MAG: aminotransferase class V-fold PLP-dependent enzyme, partial [Terriglobales bacterium]
MDSAPAAAAPAAARDDPRWRAEFPVTEKLVYLNHAAVAPLSRRARAAMAAFLAEATEQGAWEGETWMAGYDACRQVLARLLGAGPNDIALLKNTTEGMATVALGLDWRPGDRILTVNCEFPANLYPWLALRAQGVEVEFVPQHNGGVDLEALRRQARGARLVALSWVQYLSGARLDVAAVGEICREAGALFFLDAIQGLGALPLNAPASGVDFLAADGHKWLAAPEGAAVFYVHPDALARLTPRVVGWMSVEPWADFSAAARLAAAGAGRPAAPLPWRGDARRFECGTLNTLGLRGLAAAAELLLEVGPAAIERQILA